MIDHLSIPVVDLVRSTKFYQEVLAEIDLVKLIDRPKTVGFGKKYPEFWLNVRPHGAKEAMNDGFHVCLRAKSAACVNRFYETAVQHGATADGKPGIREEYATNYYAAFIQDFDGNRIEVVTFM